MAKILVSACLAGCDVRYDGGALPLTDSDFNEIRKQHQLVAFCPEVSAGLQVPRAPAEIIGGDGVDVLAGRGKVITTNKVDVTDKFIVGARLALEKCQAEGIRFAILVEKSPSCGSAHIYDGTFSRTKKSGAGCTTALLRQHGISVFSQNEIGQVIAVLESTGTQP